MLVSWYFNCGNMHRPFFVIIISLVWLANSFHNESFKRWTWTIWQTICECKGWVIKCFYYPILCWWIKFKHESWRNFGTYVVSNFPFMISDWGGMQSNLWWYQILINTESINHLFGIHPNWYTLLTSSTCKPVSLATVSGVFWRRRISMNACKTLMELVDPWTSAEMSVIPTQRHISAIAWWQRRPLSKNHDVNVVLVGAGRT